MNCWAIVVLSLRDDGRAPATGDVGVTGRNATASFLLQRVGAKLPWNLWGRRCKLDSFLRREGALRGAASFNQLLSFAVLFLPLLVAAFFVFIVLVRRKKKSNP